ncbi:MAG TPA: two-component regulator propeller domain-containing protein, partial [Bacteroidia bacterium]|nr:two-component regulator propeller domain-containing protein [Bacteroidia bacterium]
MWFGTNNGLYRYDGVNLRYFSHKNDDTTSLPNNRVLGIAEGNDGQLWISLLTGIAKIDLTTLQYRAYSAIDKKTGVGNYTNKICTDD